MQTTQFSLFVTFPVAFDPIWRSSPFLQKGHYKRFLVSGAKETSTVTGHSTSREKDYFSLLPNEIAAHVFSFLSSAQDCGRVPQVCKNWKKHAEDHSLWKSFCLNWWELSFAFNCSSRLR